MTTPQDLPIDEQVRVIVRELLRMEMVARREVEACLHGQSSDFADNVVDAYEKAVMRLRGIKRFVRHAQEHEMSVHNLSSPQNLARLQKCKDMLEEARMFS